MGCGKKEEKQKIGLPPTQNIAPNPQQQQNPKVYSAAYIKGYQDGYAGNWLAPIRWTLVDDYRIGRNAGANDRQLKLPNKFN